MPFSQKSLDFLFENRLHDSKEWFLEHKNEYETLVKAPLTELSAALGPVMLELDPQLTTDPAVGKTISRIRRDTRFTHDKSLYRDNMWIVYKRGKMYGREVPGLYFEVFSDGHFGYGCGFYDASTAYMETLRAQVRARTPAWKKADKALRAQQVFALDGERYKRPHFPDAPAAQRDWLELRGISFNARRRDPELLFSDRMADELAKDFRLLAPLYGFLLEVAHQQRAETVQRPWELEQKG